MYEFPYIYVYVKVLTGRATTDSSVIEEGSDLFVTLDSEVQ